MKNALLCLALLGASAAGYAADTVQPTFTEWHDLQVNEINRFPLHANFFAYENRDAALRGDMKSSSNYLSIEGAWKFNWVANADKRPTDFYKTDLDDSCDLADGDYPLRQVYGWLKILFYRILYGLQLHQDIGVLLHNLVRGGLSRLQCQGWLPRCRQVQHQGHCRRQHPHIDVGPHYDPSDVVLTSR